MNECGTCGARFDYAIHHRCGEGQGWPRPSSEGNQTPPTSPDLRSELAKAQERVKELEAGRMADNDLLSRFYAERDQARTELARMREALELIADMPCDSDERQVARKALVIKTE